MDNLFNLLQLPQHWPHPHPHHQQALQGWLHSHRCVRVWLCDAETNGEMGALATLAAVNSVFPMCEMGKEGYKSKNHSVFSHLHWNRFPHSFLQ